MKRLLVLGLLALLFAVTAFAQNRESDTGYGKTISTAGSDCTTATTCVELKLPLGAASASVTITAVQAFNGVTLNFEASADHKNWTSIPGAPPATGTAVLTVTAAGTWRLEVSGFRYLRVRASVITTAGVAGVFIVGSDAPITIGATTGP